MTGTERTAAIAVAGGVLSVALAWAAVHAMVVGWEACGDYEPQYGWGLTFFSLPIIAVTSWTALALVAWANAAARWWWAFLRAGLAALLVACLWVASSVPMNAPASYDGASADFAACGPAGVPTWWPALAPLLPHGESQGLAMALAAVAGLLLLALPGVLARRARGRAAGTGLSRPPSA